MSSMYLIMFSKDEMGSLLTVRKSGATCQVRGGQQNGIDGTYCFVSCSSTSWVDLPIFTQGGERLYKSKNASVSEPSSNNRLLYCNKTSTRQRKY